MRQRLFPSSGIVAASRSPTTLEEDGKRRQRLWQVLRTPEPWILAAVLSVVVATTMHASRWPVAADLESADNTATRHVLLAVSGNNTGLVKELEVSLKSLLLNAPLDNPLQIHVMADEAGTRAIRQLLLDDKIHLQAWNTRQTISLAIYTVEARQDDWANAIQRYMARASRLANNATDIFRHSMGTYYRLFAGQVLPNILGDYVLYMVTDVVLLANINDLWKEHPHNGQPQRHSRMEEEDDDDPPTAPLFLWGEQSRCAGFMLYQPQSVETLWKLWSTVPDETLEQLLAPWPAVDDQLVLRAIQRTFPHLVGSLPKQWDISAMDGPWKYKPHVLLKHRPQVSMLHYNGGGQAGHVDGAFFEQHSHYQRHALWRLSEYYVNMPWSWAQNIAASQIQPGSKGFGIQIEFHVVAAAAA